MNTVPVAAEEPPRAQRARRSDLLALAVLAGVLLFPTLGSGSLRDWDEAIYAQVGREIWEGGDWITPHLHGKPWLEKPPLYLWTSAASYQAIGVGELAPRLGAAVSAWVTVLLTYLLGARAFGRTAGLIAALVLLGTPQFLKFGHMGMLDVPLTAAVTLALYGWWRGLRSGPWLLVSGCALGLGVMTKGAAAGLAPAVMAMHLAWAREWRILRSPLLWASVLLALAIAVPWHAAAWQLHGEHFLEGYLGYHLFARLGGAIEGHAGGPLFYLGALLDGQRAWFLATLVALPYAAWRAFRDASAELQLVVCWVGMALLIPTLASTKLEWYVIPAYPELALCIGFAGAELLPRSHRGKAIALALVILLANVATTRQAFRPDYNPEVKALAPHIRRNVPLEDELCVYRQSWPSVSFYGERRTSHVRSPRDPRLDGLLERSPIVWCVVRERHLEELERFGPSVKARAGDHLLVRIPGRSAR